MNRGVLFLCTGNACRSQMAEGLARRLLSPEIAVCSAGTSPAGLDPRAVNAVAELGIDISTHRSKPLSEVPLDRVDRVITLCDDARRACPSVPGRSQEHWPIADPASVRGTRDQLVSRVEALAATVEVEPALGVIGGSGSYALPGLEGLRSVDVETPYGPPSGPLRVGRLGGGRVVFLARHGERHPLLPGEVDAWANIHALERLGVTRVVSVSAVGSLREEIAPVWRSWGTHVVGMTALPEARLAREAELSYATLALPTDYGCWRTRDEEVRVADVLAGLSANVERARRILASALAEIDPAAPCACQRALDTALRTPPDTVDGTSRVRLHPLLVRRLRGSVSAQGVTS